MQKISIRSKILIHLYEFRALKDRYQYPMEISQEGIANAMHNIVAHIPREINKLIELGYVEKIKGKVTGKDKKLSVYFLTYNGIEEAIKTINKIKEEKITIDHETKSIRELSENRKDLTLIEIIDMVQKNEMFEKFEPTIEKTKFLKFYEVKFEQESLIDRKEELDYLKNWLNSKISFLVIIGSKGYGKTALIKNFVVSVKNYNILFLNFYNNRTFLNFSETTEKVLNFESGDFKKEFLNYCIKNKILLIIDSYFLVDEETVDFFNSLVDSNLENSKILVSMREDTPYYNRFYDYLSVDKKVLELKIKGLDREHTAQYLGKKMDEKLDQIYKFTKGNPSILKLLKEKNEKKLRENTNFTPEQIKLLLFLNS
jgi:DNA replication protein DnaC